MIKKGGKKTKGIDERIEAQVDEARAKSDELYGDIYNTAAMPIKCCDYRVWRNTKDWFGMCERRTGRSILHKRVVKRVLEIILQ